ncbi:hypothetical protein LguiA_010518 [Lonicera macranthoides]
MLFIAHDTPHNFPTSPKTPPQKSSRALQSRAHITTHPLQLISLISQTTLPHNYTSAPHLFFLTQKPPILSKIFPKVQVGPWPHLDPCCLRPWLYLGDFCTILHCRYLCVFSY